MSTSPDAAGLRFVDGWDAFGDAPALVSGARTISYAELDDLVRTTGRRLGSGRRLILLHGHNTVESIVAYLAALRSGHPVILVDGTRQDQFGELCERFDPDVVIAPQGWQERRTDSRHTLHPDLRLLLSTSGSTGSPKLVRLSATNLTSNASAIAEYLRLTTVDRAITSLPLAYSYGLSVLHSHLEVGASVVLTQDSVVDPAFWSSARSHAVTSFAAVPHTFALLDRSGAPWSEIPSLRYITSAGGRLDPARAHRLASLGRERGWQLYVMYGQTEATARMAYLDPEMVLTRPSCIGRAVPGGTLRVDQPDADGVGELVYCGPNVMMGYAETAADLAAGPELLELRTGDLGRQQPDGLLEVVGRLSRFAKVLGHRIDLDRVQAALAAFDPSLVCLSDDHQLLVAVTEADPLMVRAAAVRLSGLPPALVAVRQYATLPLLPNGKPDLAALRAPAPQPDQEQDTTAALRTTYARILGYDRVDPDTTFVQLGGDSLSYVEMACHLEELLGRLPPGWPVLTIRELASARSTPAAVAAPGSATSSPLLAAEGRPRGVQRRHRSLVARAETSMLLRAAAILLVVLAHLDISSVRGGAHLLLAMAGHTFARFSLSAVRASDRVAPLLRSLARVAVPSVIYISLLAALTDRYGLANAVLLNHVFGPQRWRLAWSFWFIEVLVAILVALALVLAIPAVRRLERRHRTLLPALMLGLGLLVRPDVLGPADATLRYYRPMPVFWLFALGWLIQVSAGTVGRLLASGLVLVTLGDYFPTEPARGQVVQLGLTLLIWLPALPVPRLLGTIVRRVAAASLWIYLTHWTVWPVLLDAGLPRTVIVLGCLVVGVATADAVGVLQTLATRLIRLRSGGRRPTQAEEPVAPRADANRADDVKTRAPASRRELSGVEINLRQKGGSLRSGLRC